MNANEARKIQIKAINNNRYKLKDNLLKDIENAAKQGLSECYFFNPIKLDMCHIMDFEELGFKVTNPKQVYYPNTINMIYDKSLEVSFEEATKNGLQKYGQPYWTAGVISWD